MVVAPELTTDGAVDDVINVCGGDRQLEDLARCPVLHKWTGVDTAAAEDYKRAYPTATAEYVVDEVVLLVDYVEFIDEEDLPLGSEGDLGGAEQLFMYPWRGGYEDGDVVEVLEYGIQE